MRSFVIVASNQMVGGDNVKIIILDINYVLGVKNAQCSCFCTYTVSYLWVNSPMVFRTFEQSKSTCRKKLNELDQAMTISGQVPFLTHIKNLLSWRHALLQCHQLLGPKDQLTWLTFEPYFYPSRTPGKRKMESGTEIKLTAIQSKILFMYTFWIPVKYISFNLNSRITG